MIKNIRDLPYSERLKKLDLPSLEYRRERADMIQVYRIYSGYDKLSIERFFPNPGIIPGLINPLRGSNSRKIYKRRCNKETRRLVFSQRVVNAWNSLPNEVVTAPSLNAFKSRLNRHWVGGTKFSPVCYEGWKGATEAHNFPMNRK